MKMIKIDDDTHLEIKTKASSLGMSIKEYIKYLINKEK